MLADMPLTGLSSTLSGRLVFSKGYGCAGVNRARSRTLKRSARRGKKLTDVSCRLGRLVNLLLGSHSMRFTVVLEQESDEGFVASVPALPGCVSQGDTREEALRNIREAIELYLEDCRESGDPMCAHSTTTPPATPPQINDTAKPGSFNRYATSQSPSSRWGLVCRSPRAEQDCVVARRSLARPAE